jgi:hypothetical protein
MKINSEEKVWPTGQGFPFSAAKINGKTGICVLADQATIGSAMLSSINRRRTFLSGKISRMLIA